MADILQETIAELKEKLHGKFVTDESLDEYLKQKGFGADELNYVKGEMIRQGFSFMNGTVTYRGADFVAPMPPNVPH